MDGRIHIGDLKPGDVALLRDVAEQAAEQAVKKAFTAMGLDPREPIQAQRDFAFLREMGRRVHDGEFTADLEWLRRSRKRSEGLVGKMLATALGVAVLGAIHALWVGIQTMMGGRP